MEKNNKHKKSHHKKSHHKKSHCKKSHSTEHTSHEHTSHEHTSHKHNTNCGCCKQLFYAPLPNLPSQPLTERVRPIEWFAPGNVQACCSICSTIKPVYSIPCNNYCCNNHYWNNKH
jgi:hypothetical protein